MLDVLNFIAMIIGWGVIAITVGVTLAGLLARAVLARSHQRKLDRFAHDLELLRAALEAIQTEPPEEEPRFRSIEEITVEEFLRDLGPR